MGDIYYYQPKYFDKFSCIADKCKDSCCRFWRIDWFKHECDRLTAADCSDELREKINTSFVPNEKNDMMKIKLKDDGSCPFLDECGLCSIQKELGHTYLSATCQIYPREVFRHEDRMIRCCAGSCPAALELILGDEHAMDMELILSHSLNSDSPFMKGDRQKNVEKYPKVFFRMELLNFFIDLFSNKRRSMETSLIMGALAAKKISDIAETDKVREIPKLLDELKTQLNSRVTEKSIDEIKPNYNIKLKMVNNIIVKFFGDSQTAIDLSPIYEDGGISEEKYLRGLENARNAFSGDDRAFRNLAINSFMQLHMPFRDPDMTIFENYIYFVSICSVYRMVAAVTGFSCDDVKSELISRLTHFNRRAEHNFDTMKKIIADFNSIGFTSAAHLALIIK